MKEVVLNTVNKKSKNYKKYVALVDDEDYQRVSRNKWTVVISIRSAYVYGSIKGKRISLQTFIMKSNKGQYIDHIDGNGLNNQRSNLRFCTKAENSRNKKPSLNGTSKYLGVSYNKDGGFRKWVAQIYSNGKKYGLGSFYLEEDAADEYNKAAKKYHGEFARLNDVG